MARSAALALASAVIALASIGAAAAIAAASEQAAPGAAGKCDSPSACFERFAALQHEIRTLSARFRQTKRIALMREPLVSSGTLLFSAPDRIRWEVLQPEPLVVEIAGAKMRAGEPGKEESVEAAGAAAVFRDLGSIFTATAEYARTRFAIEAGTAGPDSFKLVPRDPTVSRTIASLELTIDPATGVLRRATIREANGDQTEIDLFDVQRNREVGLEAIP